MNTSAMFLFAIVAVMASCINAAAIGETENSDDATNLLALRFIKELQAKLEKRTVCATNIYPDSTCEEKDVKSNCTGTDSYGIANFIRSMCKKTCGLPC